MGESAKGRKAKGKEEGKEAFLSELLGSPHCPDLGLNHRFSWQHRAFIGARNQSIGQDEHNLELGRQSVLCEAVWYNG